MAKLSFRYGAMGSSKSANAMMVAYNYTERKMKVALVKPRIDNRDGSNIIKSRIGLEMKCEILDEFLEKFQDDPDSIKQYSAIIVDEVQFASPEQIDDLSDIVDNYDIPVICYGLRADFQNKFFPGSLRLMEIADEIKEVITICWCGRKARCNARYNEQGIVREGEQVMLGANDKYISLCRRHFKQGNLGPRFWKDKKQITDYLSIF